MTDTAPAIAVEAVSFCYPGAAQASLSNVSLRVEAGSCFGLLGPNGAGKTTLLSLLNGILPLQQGRIRIQGHSIEDRHFLRRHSAIAPQDYAFYPTLTGRENLDCFAGLYGLRGREKRQHIDQAVAITQLDALLDKPAQAYSGGVKRRLNLAIALLNQPGVLYLDEPTVGIDAQSRNFILDAISQLRREGMTIVYTSHYMEEIQALCDSVAIIDHGRLLLQDSLNGLMQRDHGQQAQLLLDRAPDVAQRQALSTLGQLECEGARLRLQLHHDSDAATLTQAVQAQGLQIRQMQFGVNRLEDVYLNLTRRELRDA